MSRSWQSLRDQHIDTPEKEARVARIRELMVDADDLAEIRETVGLTQGELAGVLGVSQSRVSKLESGADIKLSTLRRYVEAAGGELEVVVRWPKEPGAPSGGELPVTRVEKEAAPSESGTAGETARATAMPIFFGGSLCFDAVGGLLERLQRPDASDVRVAVYAGLGSMPALRDAGFNVVAIPCASAARTPRPSLRFLAECEVEGSEWPPPTECEAGPREKS